MTPSATPENYTTLTDVTRDRRQRLVGLQTERQVAAFVAHYNHARYHESLDNLTPADVYFGRAQTTLLERKKSNETQSEIAACNIGLHKCDA